MVTPGSFSSSRRRSRHSSSTTFWVRTVSTINANSTRTTSAGPTGDRIRRSATTHVTNVSGVHGTPEDGRQSRVYVAPALIAKHGVLRVIDGIETVSTVTVLRPAHPMKTGTDTLCLVSACISGGLGEKIDSEKS